MEYAEVKNRTCPILSGKQSDRKTIRWYLLFYPFDKQCITSGLEQELERRRHSGETLFEYFAPTYVESREADGKILKTQEKLLHNYFFIHASEDDLFVLKRHQPQYSVLRRITNADGTYHYPYVKDSVIKTLQCVARAYGYIPLCLDPGYTHGKVERIRITKGRFKGVEACLVTRPKSTMSEIMIFVDNWMCVPLTKVSPTQYEVTANCDTFH